MGRFFLTVSRASVVLWTLEPDDTPHRCREIFPGDEESLPEHEIIVQTMVTRPGQSLVAYLAVQISQRHTHRLRTEIYQIHLSRPGLLSQSKFGQCAIHETEGALIGFKDYVLAYALGDSAQTILLCCWVTKRATRLVTSGNSERWEYSTCRTLAIGSDVIVVVKDTTAEIYPRNKLMILEPKLYPSIPSEGIITGDFTMLPITYATDTAIFPSSFVAEPRIFIHTPRSAGYTRRDNIRVGLSIRVISLIGVARSPIPRTDLSIPYFVTTARSCPLPTAPGSSGSMPPAHTAPPPNPTLNAQPSPHAPPIHTNAPIPRCTCSRPEQYKFVFHIHALQPRHPHLEYGPIFTGPNGRGVMLATNVGSRRRPDQPRQYVIKYRHPSDEELYRFIKSQPAIVPRPPPPPNVPVQQPQPQPPLQPQVQPPLHPLLNPPHPDPFGPLLSLTRPIPLLDVMRGMSALWCSSDDEAYELLAWDEGAGTVLVASRKGDLVVLECAKPALHPLEAV